MRRRDAKPDREREREDLTRLENVRGGTHFMLEIIEWLYFQKESSKGLAKTLVAVFGSTDPAQRRGPTQEGIDWACLFYGDVSTICFRADLQQDGQSDR